jgi:hypothetical protein
LVEKGGIELRSLGELMPDALVVAHAGMLSSDQSAAEYPRALVISQGGASIGRALRLRIESLLI